MVNVPWRSNKRLVQSMILCLSARSDQERIHCSHFTSHHSITRSSCVDSLASPNGYQLAVCCSPALTFSSNLQEKQQATDSRYRWTWFLHFDYSSCLRCASCGWSSSAGSANPFWQKSFVTIVHSAINVRDIAIVLDWSPTRCVWAIAVPVELDTRPMESFDASRIRVSDDRSILVRELWLNSTFESLVCKRMQGFKCLAKIVNRTTNVVEHQSMEAKLVSSIYANARQATSQSMLFGVFPTSVSDESDRFLSLNLTLCLL